MAGFWVILYHGSLLHLQCPYYTVLSYCMIDLRSSLPFTSTYGKAPWLQLFHFLTVIRMIAKAFVALFFSAQWMEKLKWNDYFVFQ